MATHRRLRAWVLATTLPAWILVGCASTDPGPAPLTIAEQDAVTDGLDEGSTVREALELARAGTVGFIDVRVAAGVGQEEIVIAGAPPDAVLDWVVVGLCGYADTIPSVEVAAVPADAADAVVPFELVCDGPAASPGG